MLGAAIDAVFWAVSSKLFRFYVSNFANYNQSRKQKQKRSTCTMN